MDVTDRLAITASSLGTDVRLVPAIARQLGIQGLLFEAFSPSLTLWDLSQTGRREFRHVLTAHGRQIAGLRLDLGNDGLSPKADVDHKLSLIERSMDAARGLMAPLVCVELGPLPTPSTAAAAPKPVVTQDMAGLILLPNAVDLVPPAPVDQQTPADQAFITHLDPVMIELGQRADRYGVMLAFRSELSSLAALQRTVTAAACPWFGIDFDPVATLRDGWALDETFSLLGPLIRHVRARDAVKGTAGRTKPALIGRGSLDWTHLLANLDAVGFRGWVTIDPVDLSDRLAAATTGVTHFRQK